MENHIETAFFGFGGTTKNIPELLMETAGAVESMDRVLLQFNELEEKRDRDKAYYYEGQTLLKKLNSYRKRIDNRIDKLIVAHNRETRDYIHSLNKK